MAILISGILIAIVIAFKDNSPKYSFVNQESARAYLKMNTQTGYVCYGNVDKDKVEKYRNKKSYESWAFCKD